MGQIQVMSEALANQIAAGEVVERPASCVKELVENSMDAGARQIRVAIEEGGISSIVVQDDGHGMDESDAVLSFARHATSKLSQARDLFRINTLGFRGEALASIAAVARVHLQTRTADSDGGVLIAVSGSEMEERPVPVGMPPGTVIEVRDLFFNTPARLKYLRSVSTEQARCLEVVQKAALCRPDIAFRFEVGGHPLFQSPGRGSTLDVLAALYGAGEAKQFIPVDGASTNYRIHGFVGRPTQAKASRAIGNLFINQRPIRNLPVHQAVVAGYHGRIMVNRHPIYALYIEMDPGLVDVNIHPHKAEVRFSEERDLCNLVQDRVRTALDGTFLVPTVQFPGGAAVGRENRNDTYQSRLLSHDAPGSPQIPFRQSPAGSGNNRPASVWHPPVAGGNGPRYGGRRAIGVDSEQLETVLGPGVNAGSQDSGEAEPLARQTLPVGASDVQVPDYEERPTTWRLRPIGQALGMYILADDGETLYIIDQHAAHERVLYERFSKRMMAKELHVIPLLTPVPLHLTAEQLAAVTSRQNELAQVGLEFEQFGGRDVLLRTVPDVWEGLDIAGLAESFVAGVERLARVPNLHESVREDVVMRACKAAIKANRYLSDMEMDALCEALSNLDDPFHCPHGRPVFIRLTGHDLEKEFRRIV